MSDIKLSFSACVCVCAYACTNAHTHIYIWLMSEIDVKFVICINIKLWKSTKLTVITLVSKLKVILFIIFLDVYFRIIYYDCSLWKSQRVLNEWLREWKSEWKKKEERRSHLYKLKWVQNSYVHQKNRF